MGRGLKLWWPEMVIWQVPIAVDGLMLSEKRWEEKDA